VTRPGNWEAGLHSTIGRDVSVGPHGASVLVPCHGVCGQTHTIELAKATPPQGVRRKLEVAGWRIGRRRLCPNCNKPAEYEVGYGRPPKHTQFQPGQSGNPAGRPRTKETPVPKETPPPIPTEAARAMRRSVIQWLEEAYDVPTSAYRAGVTDASIAKETGAPEALVGQLREENYGPLAEPSELAEVRAELAAIKREAADARQALDMKLSALNGRQTAAEQKLARVAKANGWPL
jgi:hypothetical protein